MDGNDETGTQARFAEYTSSLASLLGHADRVRPFEDYCNGLSSAKGRKSAEPLAAVTAPERAAAQRQSLMHFVAQALSIAPRSSYLCNVRLNLRNLCYSCLLWRLGNYPIDIRRTGCSIGCITR